MLRIRQQQLDALGATTRAHFRARMAAHLREHVPIWVASRADDELAAWVAAAHATAERHGLDTEPEAAQLILLLTVLGADAADRPAWAREVLEDDDLAAIGKLRRLVRRARERRVAGIEQVLELPPPPTQARRSTLRPTQRCPFQPPRPCDVDSLTLVVRGGDEAGAERELTTRRSRRRDPVPDVLEREARRLLASYDLVIDVIADPPGARPATVAGRAGFHGRACPIEAHPRLSLTPLARAEPPQVEHQPSAHELVLPATHFHAPSSFLDHDPSQPDDNPFDRITGVFGIIKAAWDSLTPACVELRADGCGVRDTGDARAATHGLLGLARIYRRSKWSIGMKIPRLGSFERERSFSPGWRAREPSEHDEEPEGLDLVVTYNDTELEVGKTVEKVLAHLGTIRAGLTDLRKLFKMVPQVGWKLSVEASLFSGTLAYTCAAEHVEQPLASGRYYAVQWVHELTLEMVLIELELTLSFGLEARAAGAALVLKIEGSLSLEAGIGATVRLDLASPSRRLEVRAEAGAELRIVGYVSLLGKTLADAELSVGGGLKLDDAEVVIEPGARAFDFKGKLLSKSIEVNGYIRAGWFADRRLDPVELMAEEVLHTFG